MKKDKIKNNMKRILNKTEKKENSTQNRKEKTKEKTRNKESINNKRRICREKASFQKILLFYLMRHHLQTLLNGLKLIKLQMNLIRSC